MDDWSLEKISEVEPPLPEPICNRDYKVTYFLASQSISDNDRQSVSDWVWHGLNGENVQDSNYNTLPRTTSGKHVLTYSHLDAIDSVLQGKEGSELYIVNPETIGTGISWDWLNDNFPNIVNRTLFIWTNNNPADVNFDKPISEPYVVTSRFNEQRSYGLHEGIDIVGQGSQNILAAEDGVVERVTTGDSYGKYIRIRHTTTTNIYHTWYCHLSEQYVSENQLVEKGQVIGKQGSTGNSSGLHLHFNIQDQNNGLDGYVIDKVRDPEDFINFGDSSGEWEYSGVAVTFADSIHGPGSDNLWTDPSFVDMINYLDMPSVYMSNGINVDHAKLDGIVRMFPNLDNYKKSPTQLWSELKPDIKRWWDKGFRKYIPLNEPNLETEGLGVYWNNPEEFGQYLLELSQLILADYPDMKLYFTPMSPQFGGQIPWIDTAWSMVEHLYYGFSTHVYSGITDNVINAKNELYNQIINIQERYCKYHPLIVSECSVNRPSSDILKAETYKLLISTIASRDGIEMVCFYISHWYTDPNQENWFGTTIPQLYKQ